MNRNNRTVIVFVLSVLVAGAASFFVYRAVQQIPVREIEVKSYQVAVASRALPVGTMLTASDVRLIAWPASSPVAGGYSSVEEVVNRGLVAPVVENEPLTASKVAVAEAGAGLPPTITSGMRAISVKVNEVIGVAGFVVPGTRVDVVVTLARKDESISRVVVTNVQVLTAGHALRPGAGEGRQARAEHGGDAPGDARGRRAHRARVGRRPGDADAPQPARHRSRPRRRARAWRRSWARPIRRR